MTDKKLSDRIRERRKELKMSQEELAKLAGYTDRSTISRIEKGLIDLSESKIITIASALKTTPSFLVGWDIPITNTKEKESEIDDIITTYNLTPEELLEYNKIKDINRALFFNKNQGTDEDKQELDETLKKIFIKSLLKKREEEKNNK
ncbi:helix-turn-helix domain-containing protein [Fusobacterium varium]